MGVPIALTIAGSDSGGGAGIQADLKTFSALGVYGASVITALTAQNTKGVFAIHEVPADFITAQIDAVFSDFDVGAVKIGMLGNAAAIAAVTAGLDLHRARNVVLDPVLAATSGEALLRADAIGALHKLITRASLLTPNLPEAAALLDMPIARDEDEMRAQAKTLLALGASAVLIKGGHGGGPDSVDLLVDAGGCTRFAAPRLATDNTPRHRLHAGIGDRRRPCQGSTARRGGRRRQDLCERRHCRGRPAQYRLRPRPGASFLQLVVGDRYAAAGAPGCLSGWARAKASIVASAFAIRVKFGNGVVSTLKNFAPAAWLAKQISASVTVSPWQ